MALEWLIVSLPVLSFLSAPSLHSVVCSFPSRRFYCVSPPNFSSSSCPPNSSLLGSFSQLFHGMFSSQIIDTSISPALLGTPLLPTHLPSTLPTPLLPNLTIFFCYQYDIAKPLSSTTSVQNCNIKLKLSIFLHN